MTFPWLSPAITTLIHPLRWHAAQQRTHVVCTLVRAAGLDALVAPRPATCQRRAQAVPGGRP